MINLVWRVVGVSWRCLNGPFLRQALKKSKFIFAGTALNCGLPRKDRRCAFFPETTARH